MPRKKKRSPRDYGLSVHDAAQIDQALRACDGNMTEAAKVLGLNWASLNNAIERNPELRIIWRGELQHPTEAPPVEMAITRGMDLDDPAKEKLAKEILTSVSGLKTVNAMRKAGMTESQIQQFRSFTEFAGHGLRDILQASYGSLAMALIKIPDRIKYLEGILEDETTIKQWVQVGPTKWMEVDVPKYPADMKAVFHKQYIMLLDLQRKITETCNDTAELHLQAQEEQDKETSSKKPMKQLRAGGKSDYMDV